MASLRQPNKQDWAALRAEHIGCDVKVFSQIVNGRSSIGAELAMRLAGALDTSPEFWLNAQQAVDVMRPTSPERAAAVPGGPLTATDIAARRQSGEPSCIARNARCRVGLGGAHVVGVAVGDVAVHGGSAGQPAQEMAGRVAVAAAAQSSSRSCAAGVSTTEAGDVRLGPLGLLLEVDDAAGGVQEHAAVPAGHAAGRACARTG